MTKVRKYGGPGLMVTCGLHFANGGVVVKFTTRPKPEITHARAMIPGGNSLGVEVNIFDEVEMTDRGFFALKMALAPVIRRVNKALETDQADLIALGNEAADLIENWPWAAPTEPGVE